MQRDVIAVGRNLGGSADLTLLAPIKPGFVDALETMTYKTRIKRVLEVLHGSRVASHEYAPARLLSDAVERVGVIQSVRVAVLEPEDQVLLAVTFDGSWEAYIRVLWDKVGTLLDLIFFDTVGYVPAWGNTCQAWLGWARSLQRETGFYYGPPDFTAKDMWYQRRVERMRMRCPVGADREAATRLELHALRAVLPSAEQQVSRLVQGTDTLPDDPNVAYPGDVRMVRERVRVGLQGLAALYRLTDLYANRVDGGFLRRASLQLLLEFVQMRDAQLAVKPLEEARERFGRQLAWLFPDADAPAELKRPPNDPPAGVVPPAHRDQIQGGILRGYAGISHGLVLLVSFDHPQAAEAFARWAQDAVTRDASPHQAREGEAFVNVAFTLAGLRACGLDESQLALFPEEFRQGMAARAGQLGDVRHNHPRRWQLPRRCDGLGKPPHPDIGVELDGVHAVVQLRGVARAGEEGALEYHEPHHPLRFALEAFHQATPGTRILAIQSLRRNQRPHEDGRLIPVEHFGYADGDGQPDVETLDPPWDRNLVHLGEFVHGHPNAQDARPDPAAEPRLAWLADGSFLVMRKYRQYASRLEQAVAQAAVAIEDRLGGKPADYTELVYAKLMGRTRDGLPVVADTDRGNENRFDYGLDPEGRRCPLHAHIRRAHPRTDPQEAGRAPRILRRSLPYGTVRDAATEGADEPDRGLLFMAYNADLGEQFETIQRWLAGANSTGSTSARGCPFLGVGEHGTPRHFRFEHEYRDEPYLFDVEVESRRPLFDEPAPLTQLQWGLYLFAPSVAVLGKLRASAAAARPAAPPVPWELDRGRQLLRRLEALDDAAAWKAALEDPDGIERLDAAALWACIRADRGGVLATPHGVLVADRERILRVLGDAERYTSAGQLARMRPGLGPIYLGLDAGADYREQAGPVNAAIAQIDRGSAFELARDAARARIDAIVEEARTRSREVGDVRFEAGFEAREVVEHVVAVLIESWFGLKDDGKPFRRGSDLAWQPGDPIWYPGLFGAPSRYYFQPRPGPKVGELGDAHAVAVRQAMLAFVQAHRAELEAGPAPVARAICRHPTLGGDDAYVARTMAGAIMGFSPTTIGAVLQIVREWQRTGRFGALRAELGGEDDLLTADTVLGAALADAARMRPVPPVGWRTAAAAHAIGEVPVPAGATVVLGIASGTQQSLAEGAEPDEGLALMFGGRRGQADGTGGPLHACPGYQAGLGAMLGTLTALLARRENLRAGTAPGSFVVDGPSGLAAPLVRPAAPPGENWIERLLDWMQDGHKSLLERIDQARQELLVARGPQILAWGDSWLDYRFAVDLGADLRDCLERDHDYQLQKRFCDWKEWPRIATMARQPAPFRQFLANELQVRRPRAILLSGGGNDSTEDALRAMIAPRHAGQLVPRLVPAAVDAHLGQLRAHYLTVLRAVGAEFQRLRLKLPVLVHGYDHPLPRGEAGLPRWLRQPFVDQGYDLDDSDVYAAACSCMAELIDGLNDRVLAQLDAVVPHVRVVHVDLRGTLKEEFGGRGEGGWANDLHPTNRGFELLANKLDAAIDALPDAGPVPL